MAKQDLKAKIKNYENLYAEFLASNSQDNETKKVLAVLKSGLQRTLSKMSRSELKALYSDLLEENSRRCGEVLVGLEEVSNKKSDKEIEKILEQIERLSYKGESSATQIIPMVRMYRYMNFNREEFEKLLTDEMLEEEFELRAVMSLADSKAQKESYKKILLQMSDSRKERVAKKSSNSLKTLASKMQESANVCNLALKKNLTSIKKIDKSTDFIMSRSQTLSEDKNIQHRVEKICTSLDAMLDTKRMHAELMLEKYSQEKDLMHYVSSQNELAIDEM